MSNSARHSYFCVCGEKFETIDDLIEHDKRERAALAGAGKVL